MDFSKSFIQLSQNSPLYRLTGLHVIISKTTVFRSLKINFYPGLHVIIKKKNLYFLSLKIDFVAFHQGLHCLPQYHVLKVV